jgi:integrase/recombinase XerC/integrase/recombinase XerD
LVADGRALGHSERTLGNRRHLLQKFEWWLVNEEEAEAALSSLTPARIRAFLIYLRQERPDGRFGSETPGARKSARPSTVDSYYRALRTFVNFSLAEGLLEETPLKNVKKPRVPKDQVQPFSQDQVLMLLAAARQSRTPERDAAILSLLADTGMRVSELCSLSVGDFNRMGGELSVLGKGNKRRTVYMGAAARRSLWRYVEMDRKHAKPEEPLFIGAGGNRPGTGMTASGVFQVVQAVGQKAGIHGVRCSPHTLRHTFAVNFLRGGGNVLELQRLLGHTDLTMVRRYVDLAESDLAAAHRKASPLDRMGAR